MRSQEEIEMASAAHVNTLQDYIIQAMPVLARIPGFFEIVNADEKRYDVIAGAYPDAASASSVQVAPERILLVGANPQSPKIIPALRDGCAFCENA